VTLRGKNSKNGTRTQFINSILTLGTTLKLKNAKVNANKAKQVVALIV
jgi:hypothetical protein